MSLATDRADPSIFDDLAALIAPTGKRAFEAQFDQTCRKIFGNDQCNVFVFGRDWETAPHCMLSSANDEQMRLLTYELSLEYIGGGYRSDPFLAWARSSGIGRGRSRVGILSRDQVSESGYRRRFYENALVQQKMALVAHLGDMVLYFNFYRNPRQRAFTRDDRRRFENAGTMLSRLVEKHLQLAGPGAGPADGEPRPNTAEHRERLLERLRQSFLAEPAGLTLREAEICACVAIGMTSEAIGIALGIAINTVATHRKRAYAKLGLSSQSELFALYIDQICADTISPRVS